LRQLDTGIAAGTLLLFEPGWQRVGADHLWIRGSNSAGVDLARAARLSVELSQDREHCAPGDRGAGRQSVAAVAENQSGVSEWRADLAVGRDLSVRVHLRHVRGNFGVSRAGLFRDHAEDD